ALALEKVGKTIDDVERVELNEAFSSVVVNSTKMLGADEERVNVNGGAVALGHPIGASGARILGTMIYELRRNGGGVGLAAICSGGGGGEAVLLEVWGRAGASSTACPSVSRRPSVHARSNAASPARARAAGTASSCSSCSGGPRRAPRRSRNCSD